MVRYMPMHERRVSHGFEARVREFGISIPNGMQLTNLVIVLFKGSDSFIVRLSRDQVVRANKSLVPGVRIGPN